MKSIEEQRWEESEKRREEERRSKRERVRIKKIQVREKDRKGRKVAIHCVFPMICGSGGSKSRLAKAAGPEPSGQMRGEKLHAVVARSTFRSQNAQHGQKQRRGGRGTDGPPEPTYTAKRT